MLTKATNLTSPITDLALVTAVTAVENERDALVKLVNSKSAGKHWLEDTAVNSWEELRELAKTTICKIKPVSVTDQIDLLEKAIACLVSSCSHALQNNLMRD